MAPHSTFEEIEQPVTADTNTSATAKCFPVANSIQSFWLSQPSDISQHRTTAELPSESDVVIIGAGYAGSATAYHLSQISNASITILEARDACSGATGRNGGHLRPYMYDSILKYLARNGPDAAREVAEFEISNMWAIKKVIEDEGIECDFTLTRAIDAWCNAEAAVKAKQAYKQLVDLGFEYMRDVFFIDNPERAEGYSGVKGAQAAASFTSGTMWPWKFITGLLSRLVAKGVNLQTNTPVQKVTKNESGYLVHTERGSIQAKKVVYATNGYTAGVLPEYQHNIIACKGICCHITATTKAPHMNSSIIDRTVDLDGSYLIPRTDGSIIVGGASGSFKPFREQWYRNVDDSVLIDAAKDYYDGYMQRTFKGWEKSDAKVDSIWTGVMGYSFDTSPHIGRVPSQQENYILAGFNGHGMPVIWLSAKGVAEMIDGDLQGRHVQFKSTGIPRVFETTQARIQRAKTNSEEDGDILGGSREVATLDERATSK